MAPTICPSFVGDFEATGNVGGKKGIPDAPEETKKGYA